MFHSRAAETTLSLVLHLVSLHRDGVVVPSDYEKEGIESTSVAYLSTIKSPTLMENRAEIDCRSRISLEDIIYYYTELTMGNVDDKA